jgi:hypothetical protein
VITLATNKGGASFTIVGGADKNRFSLNGDELTFKATFFRILLHSNFNNFLVLNDRGTFYKSKCRYLKYLSNKETYLSMGLPK